MNPENNLTNQWVLPTNMNQQNDSNMEIQVDCDISIDASLHDKYDYIYIIHNILDEKFSDLMDFENYV